MQIVHVQSIRLYNQSCLLSVFRKSKYGGFVRSWRGCVRNRTETMQLRDIAKAVVDITDEPMDDLLAL